MELINSYCNLETELRYEAKNHIAPNHPSYYSFCASLHREYPRSAEGDSIKLKLREIVDNSSLSTRLMPLMLICLPLCFVMKATNLIM